MRVRRGVGATTDFPTDTPLTCAQMSAAGVDLSGTDCLATPAVTSSMPSWLIPAGIGLLVAILFMGGGRR